LGIYKMGLLNHSLIRVMLLALLLPGAAKAQASEGDVPQKRPDENTWRAAPLGTLPLGEQAAEEGMLRRPGSYTFGPAPKAGAADKTAVMTSGRPENRWRYRYFQGRWWYWGEQNRWTYFNGQTWQPYLPTGEYQSVKVDPARLRIEAQEGISGYHKWRSGGAGGAAARAGNSGALGGLGLSGTQGSLGGGLSGSFTSPAGVPSALNTTSGTTTGVSGLNGAGRFVPPRGLGAGTVSGAAVGTGSAAPGR
jgi:hypothetical protein